MKNHNRTLSYYLRDLLYIVVDEVMIIIYPMKLCNVPYFIILLGQPTFNILYIFLMIPGEQLNFAKDPKYERII